MKRFACYRPNPPEGYVDEGYAVAPDKPQFEGVVFSDGTTVLRWFTVNGSTAVWPSLEDVLKIHGHPEYGTRIEWLDGPDAAPVPHPGGGAHVCSCGRLVQ